MIEITGLAKNGGPLTKRISLAPDGAGIISDGSACLMSEGRATRLKFNNLNDFADLIGKLDPNEAIALGALKPDLDAVVDVVTQGKLGKLNGSAPANLISRTVDYINYAPNQDALALIDFDTKGMPPNVKERIKATGGVWNALVSVLPVFAETSRTIRRSTSTGITRSDTGQAFPASGGLHIYLHVADGGDVERFLRTLHERCWLAGLGWHMVGAGGQLLDRSLVDRMVYAPERLVFEGAPVLAEPLVQDAKARLPEVFKGTVLDTRQACPALRIVETARLKELKAISSHALAPQRAQEREKFVAKHVKNLAEKAGITERAAQFIIERQCEGVLLPDVELPWDDQDFAGCTVADVLANPARFVGATMADPLEGVAYGRAKAMVMRRADGTPWINSFAHGRTVYELKFDARAIQAAIAKAAPDEVVETFTKMASMAELPPDELETLRNEVAKLSGIGRRMLDKRVKQTQQEQTKNRAREEKDRRAAQRLDRRPQIPAPPPDAPWLPQMQVLNDVLGSVEAPEPPMRDIDGAITQVRVKRMPDMHALTNKGANEEETAETRLPPPEQPLLARPEEVHIAEMIERYIDYIDETGRSVHLASPFVKHFQNRSDDILPVVAGIASLPIVLEDGTLLASRGLDRKRGLVFRIPDELRNLMPHPKDCTDQAVAEAMRFLTDDFLADVATDYVGKCTLIAAAITVVERALLPQRPTFFITAGRRGGGKTTTIVMLMTAVTGVRPSAAAWSTNEEERRKALFSYLMDAVPVIVWDNIARGTQISCTHIEKSCTTATYSDRKLGATELRSVAASSIHVFTGNNIAPKGDMASRSLQIRLEVDRADPENRTFTHPDPVGWTEANRGRILKALYTIMLGNPVLKPGSNVAPQTRFKEWWTLIGSSVENAAKLHAKDVADRVAAMVDDPPACQPVQIDFRKLFLTQEEDDEENAGLSDALKALASEFPGEGQFGAADVARLLNNLSEQVSDEKRERITTLREFLYPLDKNNPTVTAKSVSKRLKTRQDEPVKVGDQTLCLKADIDAHTKVGTFCVHAS